MVLAIEPGIYWPEGGGLRLEDNFLITAGGRREALPLPGRHRCLLATAIASLIWTGPINDGPRIGGSVGLYDTTLRDGEQSVGVVLDPQQKLELARAIDELGIERIEAGFPRVSAGRLGRGRADRRRRAARRGLGLLARGPRRRGGARRARRAGERDRVADLGREAGRARRHPRVDARADPRRGLLRGRARDHRRLLRRRRHACRPRVLPPGLRDRRRGGREGGGRRRHDRRRHARGGRRARRPHARVARSRTCPSTSTATTTSASRPPPRPPPSARAPPGSRARSTGWASAAATPTCVEVALTLDALYGVSTNLRLDRAREVSGSCASVSGYELEPWKPLVGENLFRRESGAVASQFHDPPAIEPYSSELVGAERSVVLGKKSGIDSIRIAVRAAGAGRARGAVARAARRGEGARRREARPRHRRRAPRPAVTRRLAAVHAGAGSSAALARPRCTS